MRFWFKIACLGSLLLILPIFAFSLYSWLGPRHHLYDASNVFTPCLKLPAEGEFWAQPGCSGISRIGERTAEMRFNDMGIRDKVYPPKAAPGIYRILVLGSSNTIGPGMEEEVTFPRQLEAALRSQGRKKVEVINGAMVGYCSVQTSFKVEELVKRYSPDLVLFQWVQGACPLFDGAWSGRVVFENGSPKRFDRAPLGAGNWQAINNFIFTRPFLFYLWLSTADQLRKAAFSRHYSAPQSKEERVQRYLEPTLAALGHMKKTAEGAGANFLVVVYQMRPFTQSVPAHLHRWLVWLLSVLVIPIDFSHEDMFAHLKANGMDVFFYEEPRTPYIEGVVNKSLLHGDVHLNEDGVRRFASGTAASLLPRIPANGGAHK